MTLAVICAALGAVIGMGFGYAVEGLAEPRMNPAAAFGVRLALAGSVSLFVLRKTLREFR